MLSKARRFTWHSYGGGTAIIGPLTLLQVPVPMAVDLELLINELDVDPFTVHSTFSFIPSSPALLAAELFATETSVDWLKLLACFQHIALASAALASRTNARPALTALRHQLVERAAQHASVGRRLATALGLPWEPVELPGDTSIDESATEQIYRTLRSLFSRENQARTLRLAHLTSDLALDVSVSAEGVAGTLFGVQIDRMDDADVEEETSQFAFIRGSRSIRSVNGGRVYGVAIEQVQGSASELPINVHINDSTSINEAINAELGAVVVAKLTGVACPWRVQASFALKRFLNSRFAGVVVQQHVRSAEPTPTARA
jgi:hypothetical protein